MSAVDEDIEKPTMIAKTEKLKQGLMQELLGKSVGYRKEKLKNLLQSIIDHRGLTQKNLVVSGIFPAFKTISAMNKKWSNRKARRDTIY